MSFTFLHAADIHLDSPLIGLSGELATQFRGATRQALVHLVDLAIERAVAFVIIAGDLFDGDWKDYTTGLAFARQAGRLHRAGIPVFLLYGNHDAESVIRKRLQLPDSVRPFSSRRAETIELADFGVALHGRSFARRETTEDLAAGYPAPRPGRFNIGVLHTALDGREGHAPYAPCSLDQLVRHGYDYWALGHVHTHAVLHSDPHVVFPGNLQGRHVRETGAKGACLVRVADGAVDSVDFVALDAARWSVVTVDASGCSQLSEITSLTRSAMAPLVEEAGGRPLAVRVVLDGLAGEPALRRLDSDHLAAELQAEASMLADAVWIESVRMPPARPSRGGRRGVAGTGTVSGRPDTLSQFSAILSRAQGGNDVRARIAADLETLGRRIGAAGDADGLLFSADEIDTLIDEARALVLSAVSGDGGGGASQDTDPMSSGDPGSDPGSRVTGSAP